MDIFQLSFKSVIQATFFNIIYLRLKMFKVTICDLK